MGNIFSIPFSQQKSLRNLAVVMGMLLAMLCSGRAVAQTLEWAKQAGGGDFDAGDGIAVDTSGNSYVTGYFDGSATFGAGEANETTLVGAGSFDIFVAKYDGNGDLVWAKKAGGTSNDLGLGIAVDTSGNSYVTGYFDGSATFGAGEANETTLVGAGFFDIFVAKYDGNGDLVWAKKAGGTDFDEVTGIGVDTSGNSYMTGSFQGSATFGAGEANETTLVSAGSGDIFVAKYDGNGDLVWAKKAGGTGSDDGLGIGVDTSGNSYVSGEFLGSATFGAGEANETTLVSAGSGDIFVAKYDGNGDLVWAKKAGGTSNDLGEGIAVDTSGNSYVTGEFLGSAATFGAGEANETTLVSAGSSEIFVAKYDGNGDLVWAKKAGGTSLDLGEGIAVDTSGNSYVTGSFQGSATFGAGEANETTLVSAGSGDIFVAKIADLPEVLSVTPSSQDFGSVNVGSSTDRNFTVQNTGEGTLNGSASISAPFSIEAGDTYSLGAGASQIVTVRFSPTSAGAFMGNVTFTGAGGATRTVTGTGVLPTFTLTVIRAGSGDGTVTATGINCGSDCTEVFNSGTSVTLTATPASGSVFTGFSGDADCSDGVVTMNASKTCTATFSSSSSAIFTDDPLVAGVTVIKRVHLTELRAAANGLRAQGGLGSFSFTDPNLTVGLTIVKRVHITDLRTALIQAASALAEPAPSFPTDPTIVAGQTVIRAAHIQELRNAVRALD